MAGPIVAAASGLLSIVKDMSSSAVQLAENLSGDDYRSKSLTQRAKQCFIESRAYVDKDIEHEKVVPGILKFSLSLQTSLVLAGLGLDGMVDSGTTVSDRLRTVSTESTLPYIDIASSFKQDSISMEAVDPNISRDERAHEKQLETYRKQLEESHAKRVADEKKMEDIENQANAIGVSRNAAADTRKYKHDISNLQKRIKQEMDNETRIQKLVDNAQKETNRLRTIEQKDITPSTDVSLPVGKIIEITLNGPNGNIYKVPLFIRVNPYMVAPELVSYLIETSGSFIGSGKRWAQLKAGEISFWKDFVFGMDCVDKVRKTLAKDREGEFAEYIRRTTSKEFSRLQDTWKKGKNKAYRTSSNLANAILVFSESSVRDGELRGQLKLSNYMERQHFFDKNYASMIFVIEPSHERVTMYLNGFKDVGHFSYSDFVRKKDLEGEDFMSVLRTISSGNISRF